MQNLIKTIEEIKDKVGLRFCWYRNNHPFHIASFVVKNNQYMYVDGLGPYDFSISIINKALIKPSEWYKYHCKLSAILY